MYIYLYLDFSSSLAVVPQMEQRESTVGTRPHICVHKPLASYVSLARNIGNTMSCNGARARPGEDPACVLTCVFEKTWSPKV